MKRIHLLDILGDPDQRRKLFAASIVALQAREGITTTLEQATVAYDKVREKGAPITTPLQRAQTNVVSLLRDISSGIKPRYYVYKRRDPKKERP